MEDIKIGSSLTFGGYNWRVLGLQNNRALIITEDIIEQRASLIVHCINKLSISHNPHHEKDSDYSAPNKERPSTC